MPAGYREVWIGATPETARPASVSSSGWQAGRPLLVCSLAADRTGAEALTNLWIYAPKSQVKATRAQDVLWSELDGALVVDAEGVVLGRITGLYHAGASDVLSVKDSGKRTVDIPVIPDYVGANPKLEIAPDGAKQLRLTVTAATFTEVWSDE